MTHHRILEALVHDEEGALTLDGVRMILLPAEVLVEIARSGERILGTGARGVLYYAGERDGQQTAARALEKAGADADRADILKQVMASIEGRGWGRLETVDVDLKAGRGVVRFFRCPVAELAGDRAPGTCYLVAGFWAGFLGALSGKPIIGYETSCRARGDAYCEYIAGPR